MDSNWLISIIIPVYNVRDYLDEALGSVLIQTYRNLEIIVIDDGSTDGSGEICDNYAEKDERVIVIHQQNKGLSGARNTGLDRMTGEAVAFLDPDDAYLPTYVEEMLTAMDREKVDLVISQYTVHTTIEKLTCQGREEPMPSVVQGRYGHADALRALADGKFHAKVWNKMYRRELWKYIRFPEGHVYEDIDVTYRIINLCGAVYALNQTLYLQRKRPGSITDIISVRNLSDRNLACSHYLQFIDENTPKIFTVEQQKRIHNEQINSMINNYVRVSRIEEIDCETLRTDAIALGKKIGTHGMRFKTKAAYMMLCSCPWLLMAVYKLYHPVRQLVYKVSGR